MPHTIGILGAGNISSRYAQGLSRAFPELTIGRIADVDVSRAEALATAYGVARFGTTEQLLADAEIDIVVNLTPPTLHAPTVIQAIEAGKNVYVEKPLATSLEDGRAMMAAAERNGVILGSAPDTFLGSAGQTARGAIDDGAIGTPIAASAFVRSSRAETWHPDPRFLFQPGGGPVMDLGPYYLAALINCLGPIERIAADARIGAPTRILGAENRAVDSLEVTVNTHAAAVLTFSSGAIATVMMSFDVWDTDLPFLEIYGTEGTLSVHNPAHFDGPVRLKRHEDADWRTLEPVIAPFAELGMPHQLQRGPGVNDLAGTIDGDVQRASAAFGFHVLEAMLAFDRAADAKEVITLESTVERPAPATSRLVSTAL